LFIFCLALHVMLLFLDLLLHCVTITLQER
jgi:hypothetical protein